MIDAIKFENLIRLKTLWQGITPDYDDLIYYCSNDDDTSSISPKSF